MVKKRIYKRALAEFLIDNGCEPLEKVKNIDGRGYNWIFELTPRLQELMTIYTKGLYH